MRLRRDVRDWVVKAEVNLRYPGEGATRTEAQRSVRAIIHVREALRRLLRCS